jgi:hypothetical protein
MTIRLDLNNAEFVARWFGLNKEDRTAVLLACGTLALFDWNGIQRDRALRWEPIHSRRAPDGSTLYAMRLTPRIRAVAKRSGHYLEMLTSTRRRHLEIFEIFFREF